MKKAILIVPFVLTVFNLYCQYRNDFIERENAEDKFPIIVDRKYSANLNGQWQKLHFFGRVKEEGGLVNGIRNGEWKFYFSSGILKYEGRYINGMKHGDWTCYYNTGVKKSIIRFENSIVTSYCKFNPFSGYKVHEGPYRDGRRNGFWTIYHENGKTAEYGYYENDSPIEMWTWFYPGEELYAKVYITGDNAGLKLYYYINGNLLKKCRASSCEVCCDHFDINGEYVESKCIWIRGEEDCGELY